MLKIRRLPSHNNVIFVNGALTAGLVRGKYQFSQNINRFSCCRIPKLHPLLSALTPGSWLQNPGEHRAK